MNDFYTIQQYSTSDNTISCQVQYNAAHTIFEGHFPQQPVVPGVCTIQMIKELTEQALSKKLLLRSTGQVKFLQLILPNIQPHVAISWKVVEQGYIVNAVLKNDADLFKFTGTFEEA